MKYLLIMLLVGNGIALESFEGASDDLAPFSQLVPLKVVKSDSKNTYEKYGIDFDGNCYTCDLAMIRLNKKTFDLVNVCDAQDLYRTEKFSYTPTADGVRVKTERAEYVLTRIAGTPIYELKVIGGGVGLKNKRLVKYYSPKAELNKFKVHDCGEFDG